MNPKFQLSVLRDAILTQFYDAPHAPVTDRFVVKFRNGTTLTFQCSSRFDKISATVVGDVTPEQIEGLGRANLLSKGKLVKVLNHSRPDLAQAIENSQGNQPRERKQFTNYNYKQERLPE